AVHDRSSTLPPTFAFDHDYVGSRQLPSFPTRRSSDLGDDCMVSAAQKVKEVVSIPVVACGNITPENGERILARGDADLIAIGRGLIADPELVNKLRERSEEHTSELQSRFDLVCRLLLEKKK